MKKYIYLFIFFSSLVFGQENSITLKEVIVNDQFLSNHYKSQSSIKLNDSIINKNSALLNQILQFETPIYIKENGLGMVSSPSFRGTSASQTSVLWNGININSSINGQTDFSTINAKSYDGIIVKPGGGSTAYGTGAIGGSIHLIDQMKWDNKTTQKLDLSYGSYDAYNINYQLHFAKANFTSAVGYARFQSNNDYKIDNYLKKNRNGKYYFNTIDANAGYRLKNQEIRFYSQFNFGQREFSLTDIYETPTMYDNQDYRAMAQWLINKEKWESDLKLAYIYEGNQYYPNRKSKNTQDLEVNSWIAKYYLKYKFSDKKILSLFAENAFSKGDGTNIKKSDRNNFGLGLIYKQILSNKIEYEASIRQDYSSVYDVPFTYSFGFNYKPINAYQFRFNTSKNFRIPTFNDLFWQTGGNPNLKAEKAIQFEIGNDWKSKNIDIQTNLFYNDIKDMIQWVPSNQSSFWTPVNNAHVKTYGAEIIGNYKWNYLALKAIYAYTESINQKTDKFLIYVPKNQFHFNVNYNWNKWNIFMQNRWLNKVFTQTDNKKSIPSYWLSNLGLGYYFNSKITTNFIINNIFNQQYQSIENRFMPGINYQIALNIKL